MARQLPCPENYVIIPGDRSGLSSWFPVEGAAGYIIEYYRTDAPNVRIAKYYTQLTRKNVLGLINGVEYFSTICAFYYEDGQEVLGKKTNPFYFIPITNRLTAQTNICLDVGDSTYIDWDYKNTIPDVSIHSGDTAIIAACPDGEITAYTEGQTTVSLTTDYGDSIDVNVFVGREGARNKVKRTTILFTGDILPASKAQKFLSKIGYDFSEAFSPEIKEILSHADYVAGSLNTTCDDHSVYKYEEMLLPNGSINYNSPSTYVDAIRDAGFNGLFTATKHNFDSGLSGLRRTRSRILQNSMNSIGTLGDNPIIRKINGVRVAFINLSQLNNGLDSECENKERDLGRYSDDYVESLMNIAQEKKADFIIVMMHWGNDNSSVVSSKQRMTAQFIAECGADVILGSGSNTLQAYEEIITSDGRAVPCLYSLGCFYTELDELAENKFSSIAKIMISEDSSSYSCRVTLIPTVCMMRDGLTTVLPASPVVTSAQAKADAALRSFYPDILFDDSPHNLLLIQGSSFLDKLSAKLPYLYDYTGIDIPRLGAEPYDYVIFDVCSFAINDNPKESLKEYIESISAIYPNERTILVRIDIPDAGILNGEIKECSDDVDSLNHIIYELEEYVIENLKPIVIDITEYYLLDLEVTSGQKEFEDRYYEHCAKIIHSIVEGTSSKFYYNENDYDFWIDRLIEYHDSIIGTPYERQVLNHYDAADIIISNSSANILMQYREQILKLKKLRAELPFAKATVGDTYANIALTRLIDNLVSAMEED